MIYNKSLGYKSPYLLGTLVLCFMVSLLPMIHLSYFENFDVRLLVALNLHRSHALDTFLKIITDSAGILSVLALLLLLCIPRFRAGGAYGIIAYIVAIVASTILKWAIHKTRPFVTYHFIDKLSSGGSPSFPSGHTTSAFVTAGVISIFFRRWYITAVVYVWAILVAYSRMALGVHYPSDVLAGAVLGSVAAVACYGIDKKLKMARK